MAEGRISKRTVDAFCCPLGKGADYLWDDALGGFGLAVARSGRKTYVIQYGSYSVAC
jgi:hypothetical protein